MAKEVIKDDEIDLLELGRDLYSQKVLIVASAVLFSFVAYMVSTYLIAPRFDSYAVIMESKNNDQGSFGGVGGDSAVQVLLKMSGGAAGNANYFMTILKSKALVAHMVEEDEFFSKQLPAANPADPNSHRASVYSMVGRIQSVCTPKIAEGGAINISCRHADRKFALAAVEGYLKHLRLYVQNNSISRAKATEEFVQARLGEVETTLEQLEANYASTKKKSGVVLLPSQMELSISAASNIRSQILQKEMQIDLYKSIMKDTDEIKRMEAERNRLQERLDQLVRGRPIGSPVQRNADGGKKIDLLTPLTEGTELGVQFAKLEKNYGMYVKLDELLKQQLELARIASKKSELAFEVVDPPQEALGPSFPNVRMNTYGGFAFGFLLASGFVFIRKQLQRRRRRPQIVKNESAPVSSAAS